MLQSSPIAYLYNPASQTSEQLIDGFVARQKEFKRIMRDIKQSRLDEVSQNFLISAQRGMGKTTLLLRLEYEIDATPELSYLIPVRFTEEQYNIVSFCNLWEVVADRLEELDGFTGIVEQLEKALEDDVDSCFELIKKALQKNEKKLLLLVDNFQDMLKKFTDNEVKALRDILHGTELQLISASSVAIEDTYRHDKPFFEFFKSIHLEGLSTKESQELFKNLAKSHDAGMENYDASRIQIIQNLTGGVPRTMIIIFEIFLDKNAEIFENLEYILDQVTPLYKHRMDDLNPQQQRVAHEIAIAWDGVTFEELKKKTRTQEDELRVYLLELQKAYFIDVNYVGTKIEIYQLKERFFNIWYLMRNGRAKNQERVKWLVKFLEAWTTPNELKERVLGHIALVQSGTMNPKGALYMGEALACMIEDSHLEYQILLETKSYLAKNSPTLAEQINISEMEDGIASDEFLLGKSYANKGEYSKAIESYKKAIELHPQDDSAYYSMGNSYRYKGEYDKSIESYQKVIKLNPKASWAYGNMGISYRKKGEYDKEMECYEKVIELNPKDDLAYYNMGSSYENKGEYNKAIASYEKAIELNPKYHSAYNNMGVTYVKKGEYAKAIASYEKAIELNPKYHSAYNNMGVTYVKKGEYDKAIASYEKAIKLNPKYDLAYNNMGVTYAKKGEYDKAIASYGQAIELNSKYARAYNSLAWLYYGQNMKKEEALILSEQAFELGRKNIYYLHTYATILLWNNKYDESIETIAKVLNGHEYLKNLDDMTEYFLVLMAKKQTQKLYTLFKEHENLQSEFKPVYYTLMYFMQDVYPTEYKRMGAELVETVEEMIAEVGVLAEKYG